MKKVAVLLAGSGVYDGSEIHESVFALLALDQRGIEYQCIAPNRDQHHVVNHLNGEEMAEQRNILVESARIARGEIMTLDAIDVHDFDGLVIPGGFGAAKNLNQWALSGPEGLLFEDVKKLILAFNESNKAICGLCMGPTVIAQALCDLGEGLNLTVGSTKEASPYDIAGISGGMEGLGVSTCEKTLAEFAVSEEHKVVTAPCYMMEGSISAIQKNIDMAIEAFAKLL